MSAMEYEQYKPRLREDIKRIYDELESTVDCVVIEGAGSPAEINLHDGDIVNMSMAKTADAPVILIGDINPGGVFAQLYGTVKLLPEDEQQRIKGLGINKFRGDVKILEPGLKQIEELLGIPVLGVIPMMDIDIEDEDSVTERFDRQTGGDPIQGPSSICPISPTSPISTSSPPSAACPCAMSSAPPSWRGRTSSCCPAPRTPSRT